MAETLYEYAGGEDALHRLEQLFYDKALQDPVLRDVFTKRVPTHVDHLTWFTAESFGGPDRFTREVGFAHLIDVHRHRVRLAGSPAELMGRDRLRPEPPPGCP